MSANMVHSIFQNRHVGLTWRVPKKGMDHVGLTWRVPKTGMDHVGLATRIPFFLVPAVPAPIPYSFFASLAAWREPTFLAYAAWDISGGLTVQSFLSRSNFSGRIKTERIMSSSR